MSSPYLTQLPIPRVTLRYHTRLRNSSLKEPLPVQRRSPVGSSRTTKALAFITSAISITFRKTARVSFNFMVVTICNVANITITSLENETMNQIQPVQEITVRNELTTESVNAIDANAQRLMRREKMGRAR